MLRLIILRSITRLESGPTTEVARQVCCHLASVVAFAFYGMNIGLWYFLGGNYLKVVWDKVMTLAVIVSI